MAIIESGTFTLSGAVPATKTIVLNTAGMTPDLIVFFVSSLGASDTDNHMNIGFLHGGGKGGASVFSDTTGEKSSQNTGSKVLSHNTRSAGTITEIITATAGALNLEEFDLTCTAVNSNYQIGFLAIEF
jgi:hypothetical protein